MQTRWLSFLEACINTAFGFSIQVSAQYALFWLMSVPITHGQFWLFTVVMTVLSVGRGFVIRRIFNSEFWKRWKKQHQS